jgi:hypothetical protein
VLPVNRSQSPDLDRQPERGQRGDPAQAAQAVHDRGELGVGGHHRDRGVEPVPARGDGEHRVVVGLERQPRRGVLEALAAQPRVVPSRPRVAVVVVDDPVAQQQLGEPVPGPHQVTAGVLTGPDQVPGGLLCDRGDGDRGDLVQPQQPGQVDRVFGVGLHPVTAGFLQLRRRRDLTPDPRPQSAPDTGRTRSGRPRR